MVEILEVVRMIENPKPGKRVEILTGNEWFPAVITRGPFPDNHGIEYWEVETQEGSVSYATARPVTQMREP